MDPKLESPAPETDAPARAAKVIDRAAAGPLRRALSAFGDVMLGRHRDYTVGSIPRAILLLAVPMVIEMAMESLFAIVNLYWVSQLGAQAAATVGVTESLLAAIYAIAMGLSMAATATVARRVGEKDRDGAARAAVQVIALGVLVAIPLGLVGGFGGRALLAAMHMDPETIAGNGGYAVTMLGGNATILFLFLLNAIFRGAGDGATAMWTLLLANGINLVLDPCLIFGLGPFPELGITGSAVATNIGRGCGVVFQLVMLARGRGKIGIVREQIRLAPAQMLTILRLASSGIVQSLIMTMSWTLLVRVLADFKDAALAGYVTGMRIVIFALLPSWGMSNAAATMVGQNLGAGKPERAERAVWLTGFYNVIFLGAVSVAFVLAAPWFVAFFTSDPEVTPHAIDCLRCVSAGFVFYAYGMVLTQSFNGAGDTWTPTWINFVVFWLLELPLAYVLAHTLGWGPRGVFVAIAVAFSTLAVISAVIFRKGRWKTRKV